MARKRGREEGRKRDNRITTDHHGDAALRLYFHLEVWKYHMSASRNLGEDGTN